MLVATKFVPLLAGANRFKTQLSKALKAENPHKFGRFNEVEKPAPKGLSLRPGFIYNQIHQPEEGGEAIDRRRTDSASAVRDSGCSV